MFRYDFPSNLRVAVATQNKGKLLAVETALDSLGVADAEVVGYPAKSGVPEQPIGRSQILEGAQGRLGETIRHFQDNNFKPDVILAMESGLSRYDQLSLKEDSRSRVRHGWSEEAAVWLSSLPEHGVVGGLFAPVWTACLPIPPGMMRRLFDLIDEDDSRTIADVIAEMSRDEKMDKQRSGTYGFLTGNLVTRPEVYAQAVKIALASYFSLLS